MYKHILYSMPSVIFDSIFQITYISKYRLAAHLTDLNRQIFVNGTTQPNMELIYVLNTIYELVFDCVQLCLDCYSCAAETFLIVSNYNKCGVPVCS